LYAGLCERFADNTDVTPIIGERFQWDAALRLLSGLHFLVLRGQITWDEAEAALVTHCDFLTRHVATQGVQTNEVQRCWMLLPCFLHAARRLGAERIDVIELGPSAGLNLTWDHYRYHYRQGDWGPSGTLEFTGEERGEVPGDLLSSAPSVGSRIGVDLHPIDVTTDDGARLLKSFVWADQTHRLDQLDRAIRVRRSDPPQLVAGDIAEVLPRLLARRRPNVSLLVWQTAVLGYLPVDARDAVLAALDEAGREGPLAFVSTTSPNDGSHLYYGLTVRSWPDGLVDQVAHADFHGAWIRWLDDAERAVDATVNVPL